MKEGTTREAAVEAPTRESGPAVLDGVEARVVDLQRSAGNAYVGRLVASLQRDTVAPPATAWGAAYLPTAQQTFEQKLTDVSALAATSATGTGTPASGDLTLDQRRYLEYPDVPQKLDVKGLEALYPKGTDRRRTIDPIGDWSFIGRGPLQVTHRLNYIEVLAYLENAAAAATSDDAATIREAIEAIKADPRQASNPAYTFLFSAAFMKTEGGDVLASKSAAKTFGGKGSESYWMTGGHADPQAAKKLAAYGRALQALGGS